MGQRKGPPVLIEVEPNAKPHQAKPYPIALKNCQVFENEFDRQCDIGAMWKVTPGEIEWAPAAFCVAKSNGTIRVVIDFRALNAALKRREYHLPSIKEMFQEIYGFHLASDIDLSMGFLSISLTKATAKLITVVTTFDMFKCVIFPMGVKPATVIFQDRMVSVFISMPKNRPKHYIDDIFLGKGSSFDEHLEFLAKIFRLLRLACKQVNLHKRNFAISKSSSLDSFWRVRVTFLLARGLMLDANVRLAPLKNVKQVRQLLGTIT